MTYTNQTAKKISALLFSDRFRQGLIWSMMICGVWGVFLSVPRGYAHAPSMESWSFRRIAYVIGAPDHPVFWALSVCGLAYWLLVFLSALPRWKKQISFSMEKIDQKHDIPYMREEITLSKDLELSAHLVRNEMISHGYHIREQQSGKEIYFTAEKNRLNKWANIFVHAGVVCFLIGIIVCGSRGMREDLYILQGIEEQVYSEPIAVNLHRVEKKVYSFSDKIAGVSADIGVTDLDDRVMHMTRLEAKKTGVINNLRYHLVDYGKRLQDAMVEMRFKGYRERTRMLRLSIGKSVPIRNTSLVVHLEKFVPDFIVEEGKITSRSQDWKNPAIKVGVFSGRRLRFTQWLFKNFEPDAFFEKKRKLSLRLNSLNKGDFINVRVSINPGIFMVWVSMILIVAGLGLRYFFSYCVIWIMIKESKRVCQVSIAGESNNGNLRFSVHFNRLISCLESLKEQ